jgi:Xaa-Pro aminopeptidase
MQILQPPSSFPPVEHERRLKALIKTLRREKLDGAIIVSDVARFYYTGFHASSGILLVGVSGTPRFLTEFRYLPAAKRGIPFVECADSKRAPETGKILAKLTASWRRVAIEHAISHAQLVGLQKPLEHVAEWLDLTPIVAAQRAVKSVREQKAIRHAVAMNDLVFQTVLPELREGATEWQIRAHVRHVMGFIGEGEAFDTIAAFGANAAECHHVSDATPLVKGKAVLLDFGIKCNHYCSDLTRTLCIGKPSRALVEIHAAVLRANRAAAKKIRAGMTGADADAIARKVLEKAGFGKAFGHGLGHGLGLEVHESPSLSPASKTRLEVGNIVTIEPGVYLPGNTGVRSEDIALITQDGCEILSTAPRELLHD